MSALLSLCPSSSSSQLHRFQKTNTALHSHATNQVKLSDSMPSTPSETRAEIEQKLMGPAEFKFSEPPTEPGLFGKLPVELRLLIFHEFDYGSAIFFAATNHYYKGLIDPLALVSDEDKVIFIREAEHYPQHAKCFTPPDFHNKSFACSGCFRVKRAQHFDNTLPPDYEKLPPPHLDVEEDGIERRPSWQFCNDCAETPRVYSHGPEVSIGSRSWSCKVCMEQQWVNYNIWNCGCLHCRHCVVWFKDSPHPKVCPTCKRDVVTGLVALEKPITRGWFW